MLNLSSNIKYIKGVGEKRAGLFGSLAIFDVDALIHFFPRKYEDWTKTKTVREFENGDVASIKATIITPVKEHMIRRGMTLYKCRFSDGESIINVTIFNNKYQAQALRVYEDYVLFGKIEKNLTSASMSSPKIERLDTGVRVHPVYPATGKLTSNAIAKVVKTALESLEEIPETLDKSVRDKYNLINLDRAIRQIHFPDSEEDMQQARYRLIFEELLTLQLGLLKLKGRNKTKTNLRMTADFTEEFKSLLPFEMTNAQKRAIKDCLVDMAGDYPMNRLLQGDVGSGKTAVAAGLCFTVIRNGYQCALMAPTEILAVQHYEGLSKMLLSTINHKEKSTSKFSPITLPFAIPVTRKHWMPPVYSIVSIKANIPVKAPAAWACLLPNRSANYISFTSDIIIQESIVSRSIFSISRNKIHFFPDFKIFSVLGSTFEL